MKRIHSSMSEKDSGMSMRSLVVEYPAIKAGPIKESKRVRARSESILVPSRTVGGTDAGATADHRLSRRAKRALLLHVRSNLGQAIIAQYFLEQLPVGNAAFRHIGTKTQIFDVRHYHFVWHRLRVGTVA